MSERPLDIRQEINSATKYVCTSGQLDMLLNDEVKEKFQDIFRKPTKDDRLTWRMHYKTTNPKDFLARFGIDFEHPTVRDAVALDLVKLDDSTVGSIGSVSNDKDYTYPEHVWFSPLEYERYLLNKNFRIHLVNLETEWKSVPV